MNYFLRTHGYFHIFLFLFSGVVAIVVFWLIIKLDKKKRIPSFLYVIIFFVSGIFTLILINNFFSGYDRGFLRKFYIYAHDDTYYLTTLNNVQHLRYGHKQYLETFEMATGKPIGLKKVASVENELNYEIYWSGGERAWAYTEKIGLQLLDLPTPKILATQKDIIESNPDLGGTLHLNSEGDVYDPLNHRMIIESTFGKLYTLNYDLNLQAIMGVPDFSPYLYKNQIWRFKKDWKFSYAKNRNGWHIRFKRIPVSEKSSIFLKPYFVSEFNVNKQKKTRIWVVHQSSLYEDVQVLLSYVDQTGQELSRVNVSDLFNNKRIIKVLGIYSLNKTAYIFIGIGSISQYLEEYKTLSLYALKVDNKTGRVIKKITYYE